MAKWYLADRTNGRAYHEEEMAYGISNGHVNDDGTWPWKVNLVTPIRLEPNISKTAGGAARI